MRHKDYAPQKALAALIRACRGTLRWSRGLLAEKSGISVPTIVRIENNLADTKTVTILKLVKTFENAGLVVEYDGLNGNFKLVVPACVFKIAP